MVTQASEADHADHEVLRGLKAVFEKAVGENQLDLLVPYLEEGFSIVSFTNREFKDFGAFKAQWAKTREQMLKGGTYAVELLPEHSVIFGEMALAKGDSRNVLVTGAGVRHEFGSRWTVLCRKRAGQWRIVRAHSSIDPFGNSMLLAGVKRKVMRIVAVVAFGGLAMGAALGALIVMMRK